LAGFSVNAGQRRQENAMPRFDGSLARQFDFVRISMPVLPPGRLVRPATRPRLLHGPDKYKVLEHRRRQAQIQARRLLDLID
jgi:hypothetical protein